MVSISFKYRQEKDKDIIRERYFSTRTQMFFFSLCVVPVDLPICVAETALNESSKERTLGTWLNRVYTFTIDWMSLRTKALEQCRVNFSRPRAVYIYRTNVVPTLFKNLPC